MSKIVQCGVNEIVFVCEKQKKTKQKKKQCDGIFFEGKLLKNTQL